MLGPSKRHAAGVLLAIVLTASVVACGGNKVADTTTTPPGSTTSTTALSDPNAKPGGSIKIGLEARPDTLDVMTVSSVNTSSWQYINDSLYDGLVGRSPVDGKVENRLAEKITPSADFKTWTIVLRKGITFVDGTPLNSKVVVDNIAYRANPANNCKCQPNFAPMHPAVVDDNTLTIALDAPDAHLPDPKLLQPILAESLLSPSAATARDRTPDGTGPFKMVDRDQLIVTKNPHYWRKDDRGRQLPFLDQITFVPIADGTVRLAALDKGDIDMLEAYDGSTIGAAQKDAGVVKHINSGAGSTVAVLNTARAPFSDLSVRQAAAKSVDRDALAQSFADGSQQPAFSFVSANSSFKLKGKFPAFDLDGAKKLTAAYLAAHGADSLKIDVVCVNIPDAVTAMPVVLQELKDAGFNPTLHMLDIGQYAQTMLNGNHNFDVACTRAGSFDSDPSSIGSYVTSTGTVNVASYKNPEMDALFVKDQTTVDPVARLAIFQKVNDIVIRDLPYLPLLSGTAAIVTNSKVHGLSAIDTDWAAHVDTSWLWKSS